MTKPTRLRGYMWKRANRQDEEYVGDFVWIDVYRRVWWSQARQQQMRQALKQRLEENQNL
jgi:hypothetical protein